MEEQAPDALGRVYLGLDNDNQRTVRVHVLDRLSVADQKAVLDAARKLLAVDHPNLERVLEIDAPAASILVEHADGEPLAVAPRPSLQQALLVGEQLAGALAAVHAAGLSHRAFDAHAAIHLGEGAVKVSRAGLVPPGVAGDCVADQQALGRVLFTLISGEAPGPSLAAACPGVPADVAAAVEQAIAGGFGSMKELEDALRACYARLTGAPLFTKVRTGLLDTRPRAPRRRGMWSARGPDLPMLPVAPEHLAFGLGLILLSIFIVGINDLGNGFGGMIVGRPAQTANPAARASVAPSLADAVVGGATSSAPAPRPPCELSRSQPTDQEVRTFLRCRLLHWLRSLELAP